MHPACLPEDELLKHCTMDRTKGSGPGGQRRNKVATGVRLTHTPSGLTADAAERREPEANRQSALFRLRLKLAVQERGGFAGKSERWAGRVKDRKLSLNESHADFPAILAESLDGWQHTGGDLDATALLLELSKSQLIKLWAKHPPALALVNREREKRGQRMLKP